MARDRVASITALVAYYDAASEETKAAGREWYAEAREIIRQLAHDSCTTQAVIAAVFSALSPQTRWSQNVAGAIRMCRAYENGETQAPRNCSLYYTSAEKAWSVLNQWVRPQDAFRRHTKTEAFFHNLIGNEEYITVDSWMARAIDPTSKYGTTVGIHPAKYREYASIVRDAARQVGETPAQFQAIVWCQIRGSAV